MSNRTVFEELSRFMPDHERDALLKRLNRSTHREEESRDQQLHRYVDAEEREERISKDMSGLSLFARIVLWLRSKFVNKSSRDAFVAMRVKGLKRAINSRYPGITGFETRDLNPKLAEEIFRIYTIAIPLRQFYRKVWTDPLDLQNMILGVLEARIPNPKRSVVDLALMERLEEIVGETGSREAVRDEVKKRFDRYIDGIPKKVFAETAEDLKPFERLRDIVLYPFGSFFQLFHFTPLEEDLEKLTFFKTASAMLCLEHLEEMHYALHAVTTIPDRMELADDFLAYLSIPSREDKGADSSGGDESTSGSNEGSDLSGEQNETRQADQEQSNKTGDEAASTGEEGDASLIAIDHRIRELSETIVERCKAAYRKIPFEELVRYFLKNPYYDLVRSVEETSPKELYVSVMRLRMIAELDQIYPELRKRVLEKEIQDLFAGKTLRTFGNYREYKSIDYQKLGLPFFIHTKSIVLLFNYVNWFYKDFIQKSVQLLDRNVLGQNRITRDRLLQYAQSVEDTAERIRQFDYSLSSDSEDGRTLQRLRYTLAQDAGHQKMYRTLVLQKDREVRSIIERGAEALTGLIRIFNDLLDSSSPNIRASMQNHYFVSGQPVSLDEIVQMRIDHIQRFSRLLDQVIKLERG